MMFSQDFVDRVIDANNLVDLVSEYTALKRSGSSLMGCCPLPGHNEKSPSFSVSESKQLYHCFGCQRSGNLIGFVKEMKGLNFPEIVEYLADRASIAMPVKDEKAFAKSTEAKSVREKMNKINKLAATFYHLCLMRLKPDHPVRVYCKARGLNDDILKNFQIGYAPKEWDSLEKYLASQHAPVDLAIKLGLIKRRNSGNGNFDMFRHRLMFPIQNHKEEFVGFGGRVLDDADQPKYLNSPESEVFSKGHIFYGLPQAQKAIRTEESVLIVEGYMDYLALYAAGFENVAATLGTALTPYHAKLVKRFTQNIVVMFDGDSAGQKAAERSLPVLLAEGLFPKGLTLPDNLDPDEYIQENGPEALKTSIKSAPELFQLQLDRYLQAFRGAATEKVALLDKVAPIFHALPDKRLYELYVSELAQKMSVNPQWVAKNLPNKGKVGSLGAQVTGPGPTPVIEEGHKIKLLGAPKAELFLLNLALMRGENLDAIWEAELVDQLSHPGVQELFVMAHEFYRQNSNGFDKLTAYLMTKTASAKEVSLHMGPDFISMEPQTQLKMIADCHRSIEVNFRKKQTREIAAKMRQEPALDQIKKLEQIVNIRKGSRPPKKGN